MVSTTEKKTVFVGLSGGVDSSVAALRLIKQGYDVVGVFIKVWHPDFLPCNWEQERLDAMRVAAKLGIPFLTCDAEKEYEESVAAYFISEYKAGKTPNPDVMCNKYVKFGAFLRFAKERGADYIATGHYAERSLVDGHLELHRGIDTTKDQSYFLWTLTDEQLQMTLLPVGGSTKKEIRSEAQNAGLLTAEKSDSQGICFLGHVDIPSFLSHYIELKPGAVVDEAGKQIGTHGGALVYTLGQRHGFFIDDTNAKRKPHYVIERNIEKSVIVVSTNKPTTRESKSLVIGTLNYINWKPKIGAIVEVQTRYRQTPTICTVTELTPQTLTLTYNKEGEAAPVGQSCVLYEGKRLLGGGIIQ